MQTRITSAETLLTIAEASEYLRCSSVFIWKLRKQGKLKALNAGRKVLIQKSEIDSYLQIKPQAL
jgi:excisionase family DNA binding protein